MKRLALAVLLLSACGGGSKTEPASPKEVAGFCELIVESEPAGAAVTIDGQLAGETPLKMSHECQKVAVVVTDVGFRKVEKTIDLVAGKQAVMQITLAPVDLSTPVPPPPE